MDAAQPSNHIILIGASNMRRLIPLLKAAGHTVTDLTQPSWLATPENIDYLIASLNTIWPDNNTTVILELFGNSTFRYRQFDGTMALPFKVNGGYHMEGDVGVCDKETFLRLCMALSSVFDACNDSTKIVIPPLPRYLYTSCYRNKRHCTNRQNEDYELSILQSTAQFHPMLKDALLKQGVEKFFVVDGISALLGVMPGCNRGAPVEIVRELSDYCGTDGVHYTETGYANLNRTIVSATKGMADGTLTKAAEKSSNSGKISGTSYFWRGFTSPVGARMTGAGSGTGSGSKTGSNYSCTSTPSRHHQPHPADHRRESTGPHYSWRAERGHGRGQRGFSRPEGGRGKGYRGGRGKGPFHHPYW
jgi:hypothetical protein